MRGNSITERVFGCAWRVEIAVETAEKRLQARRGPFRITLGEIADGEVAALLGGRQKADAAVRLTQPPRQWVVFQVVFYTVVGSHGCRPFSYVVTSSA